MQEQIYTKVRDFVQKNHILEDCEFVVAGVSGGGDSMAMLDLLRRLSGELGFQLRAVHVHHGIRGAEADRDQQMVEKIYKSWRIPCRVFRYDVPELAARWKKGLEETGRKVRKEAFYTELLSVGGKEKQKNKIALAHNKNDLAETMLHHLCRGTGLRGLSPMQPEKNGVVRPVLCLERKEIEEYLKERNIPCVLDSTNLEDEYTRNRIRHHLIPMLETEINERAVSHMAETSVLLGQAEEFLREQGKKLAEACKKGETYVFQREFFLEKEILQKYAVKEAMEALAKASRDLSMVHVRQVLDLFSLKTGARASLPYGIYGERTYEGILLRKKETVSIQKPEGKYRLPVNGTLNCAYGVFETKIFPWSDQKICEKTYTKWLDYDKIKHDVFVRNRETGDFLTVNSEGHRKKLTRCMIDEKIPREQRGRIPLVAVGNEILWIVGGRINEKYKITSETGDVLEIKYQGGKYNE